MTCIVGLITSYKVIIGGDSAGVDESYNLTIRKDPKVFRVGDMLMGITSSFRMGNLLRFNLTLPEHPDGMDAFEYMVRHFIPAVRECLKEGGYTTVKENNEEGGSWLVAYRGRLFHIESDFQVGESTCPFDACGCGAPYALGYLHNTHDFGWASVQGALDCASTFSAGVKGPYVIEEL